jgi:DNA-binding MarR family transcriptional regulator
MSDALSHSPNLSARPFQMLVRIARHSRIGDPQGCAAVFALLETGRQLRSHLHKILARHQLSEDAFSILVSLYAIDPAPTSSAELAADAEISTEVLGCTMDSLSESRLIVREESARPGAGQINLTDRGRGLTEEAVRPFLEAVARCSDALSPGQTRTLQQACVNLRNQLPSHAS